MIQMHAGWSDSGFATVQIRFASFDFVLRPQAFIELLRLPHVAHLVFPTRPFIDVDGQNRGLKPFPTGLIHSADEVDLDFWRRTDGLMSFAVHGNQSGIGLRGWDPSLAHASWLPWRKTSVDMGITVPSRHCEVVNRSWMRGLVSQVMSIFPAEVARIFVTKVGDGEKYDTKTWIDERGFRRTEAAAWLTYLDAVSLAHVGRARVETCSAHVEFNFFGGALLCTAEEPFSLHPRELYERTRKVNEELDQIEPPPPPGSPFRFRAQ